MKLADDALLGIMEILRQGLTEGRDISELLRRLDLTPSGDKLGLSKGLSHLDKWTEQGQETD